VKLNFFFSGSHLAPKYFKVVANSKKLVAIMLIMTKTFLFPCHGNRSGFSIRIKVGDRNVEVGGKGVTRAAGVAF